MSVRTQNGHGRTSSYQGYYWTPKMALNGPKQHNRLFFCPKGQKSLGRSPPQELEVGPRSGPYLLVFNKSKFRACSSVFCNCPSGLRSITVAVRCNELIPWFKRGREVRGKYWGKIPCEKERVVNTREVLKQLLL